MSVRSQGKGQTPYRFSSILLALFGLFCWVVYASHTVAGQAAPQSLSNPVPNQPSVERNPICKGLSAVSFGECDALVDLYQETSGPQWDNHANWLLPASANSPCDWFGVTCSGGHVSQLQLNSNRLRGPLPRSIGQLTHLTHLYLQDNQLRGPLPPSLCDLVDTVQIARFEYNLLTASERHGRACLEQLQPTWSATQTAPLREIRITAVTTTALQLNWTPIPYVEDGGFYAISYATGFGGNFISHGQTADKRATGYLLDGLAPGQPYRIRVETYTPAHANQENDLRSQSAEISAVTQSTAAERVLLMVYFAADNDLSPYVQTVLQRLERGSRHNPNLQVVALTDGKGDHNTSVVEIANGVTSATSFVQEKWGTDELDTADPQVLAWFLQSARQRHPASRSVVSLLGHGSGLMPEVTPTTLQSAASATPPPAIPALPRTVPHTPDDVTDDTIGMSTQDYAQALAIATDNGANPFDVVFFDQCFQGSLDVLYEMHNAARVFVASPNYAWLSAPYDRYLPALTPAASSEQMADTITQIYDQSLRGRDGQNRDYPYAIFWVRGTDVQAIAGAVNQLSTPLHAATLAGAEGLILQAALASQFVDINGCGRQTLPDGLSNELLGVGSFASNLRTRFQGRDGYGVIPAVNQLLALLENVHGLAATGRPYLAPQQRWVYTDTLTLLAPLARSSQSALLWRTSIYTSTAPLAAIWASTLPETVLINSSFAATRQGGWDDFLATWYTAPMTPTVGSGCHYTPPVQLSSEVTETLTLTVTPAATTLDFQWTPVTDESATSYWLLVRKPDGYGWLVQERLPLTTTTYQVQKPAITGEPYEFMISAQDDSGLIVAQSNQASYGGSTSRDRRVYLPVLRR